MQTDGGIIMRFLTQVVGLCCVSIGSVSYAADMTISAVEIVGYGIFTARSVERDRRSTASSPAKDTVEGVHFVEFTNDIPGKLGIGFGFQYIINTSPKGGSIDVTTVIIFPEGGLVDPRGRVYERSSEKQQVPIGRKIFYGYGFDEPWEIVPGEWIFQVWHRKAKIAQKKFTVHPPVEANDAA